MKTTVLVQNMDDFGKVNGVYAQYFAEPYPARACYEVAKLPKGVDVEIEAIAVVGPFEWFLYFPVIWCYSVFIHLFIRIEITHCLINLKNFKIKNIEKCQANRSRAISATRWTSSRPRLNGNGRSIGLQCRQMARKRADELKLILRWVLSHF